MVGIQDKEPIVVGAAEMSNAQEAREAIVAARDSEIRIRMQLLSVTVRALVDPEASPVADVSDRKRNKNVKVRSHLLKKNL